MEAGSWEIATPMKDMPVFEMNSPQQADPCLIFFLL